MNEAAISSKGMGARILGIFGGGRADEALPAATPCRDPGRLGRSELLQQIVDFLMDNDLAVSPANLLAAHGAFSGSDMKLARKISACQMAGETINQDWLDAQAEREPENANREKEIEKIVTRLEGSISAFTATTRSARTAAADYNSELLQHVEQVHEADATGQMITSLADLAKAMLERTRQVEEDMKRSEREAEKLRHSLAKAQREAEVDHLTGLPNRRAFEGLLETHYREAQKAIEPLCVAFCDIDHFKQVNDTHGHDTGDRVIQAIGQVLARISNENCHVARHGGEEFVMLFRGLNRREALEQLDRAREAMADRRFVNRTTDEPIGKITFSGGIADVFSYTTTRDALRAADEALYRAKEGGRNRIELA